MTLKQYVQIGLTIVYIPLDRGVEIPNHIPQGSKPHRHERRCLKCPLSDFRFAFKNLLS
jgi:hypothetical protein